MPIYHYYCLDCEQKFRAFHSMSSEYEGTCGYCESTEFVKISEDVSEIIDKTKFIQKPGDVVRSHIEDAKAEVKKQKEAAKRGLS